MAVKVDPQFDWERAHLVITLVFDHVMADDERFFVKIEVSVVLIIKDLDPCNEGVSLVCPTSEDFEMIFTTVTCNMYSPLELEIGDFYSQGFANV